MWEGYEYLDPYAPYRRAQLGMYGVNELGQSIADEFKRLGGGQDYAARFSSGEYGEAPGVEAQARATVAKNTNAQLSNLAKSIALYKAQAMQQASKESDIIKQANYQMEAAKKAQKRKQLLNLLSTGAGMALAIPTGGTSPLGMKAGTNLLSRLLQGASIGMGSGNILSGGGGQANPLAQLIMQRYMQGAGGGGQGGFDLESLSRYLPGFLEYLRNIRARGLQPLP